MTSFPGHIAFHLGLGDQLTSRAYAPGRSSDLGDSLVRAFSATPSRETAVLGKYMLDSGGITIVAAPPPFPSTTYRAVVEHHPRDDWFNKVHVLPRSITLGNILAASTFQIDIYNAYFTTRTFTSFDNGAGAGVQITNLPVLPASIQSQRSLILSLLVSPIGPPSIDGSLNFYFGTDLVSLPISGDRLVVFPFEPESPLIERLRFLTDVLVSVNGSEQRIALRKAPRQEFDMKFLMEEGPESQRIGYMIFDWSSRAFGLPMWHEPSQLTSSVSVGATVIPVDSTENADYRVGGMAMVFESETRYEAVEVVSLTSNSITVSPPLEFSYTTLSRVYPLRTAAMNVPVQERKYSKNMSEFSLTMRVLDNDVDLADITGWPSYGGKVLFSGPNLIDQTMRVSFDREMTSLDSLGGVEFFDDNFPFAMRTSTKGFLCQTREELWNVRQVLHALRGQQVSFWLPTFTEEITLYETYVSGSNSMVIHNVGYAKFARHRKPRRDIRIVLKDGTTFSRVITGSSELDANRESVSLDFSIGQSISPDTVDYIDAVEQVRIAADDVVIQHDYSVGYAKVTFPTKVVNE